MVGMDTNDNLPQEIMAVPLPFLANDGISQKEVRTYIDRFMAEKEDAKFHRAPVVDVNLTTLRGIAKRGTVHEKLKLVMGRHRVVVDERYGCPATDPDVGLEAKQGVLDFLLCVPRSPGLGAMLPNKLVGLDFAFSFSVTNRLRTFQPKHAMLGFDPAGSMLHIGNVNQDDVWLAFPPKDFFDSGGPKGGYLEPGHISGFTGLSWKNYIRVCHFLAYAFHCLGIANVDCDTYDTWSDMAHTLDGLKTVTNIM